MNKMVKTAVLCMLMAVYAAAALLAAWVFILTPVLERDALFQDVGQDMSSLAEELEDVDFDRDTGMLYVNNEIIVVAASGTGEEEIAELAEDNDAELDKAMADIGIYRFCFDSSMDYDELDSLLSKLEHSELVEEAHLNIVSEISRDAAGTQDGFDYRDPVYPDDPWESAVWNMGVPRGDNWGMEAIRAPGAWGYLSEMTPVRIGLIDSMPQTEHPDLNIAKVTNVFIDRETNKVSTNLANASADDHGTHVSGIMDAAWDGNGVSGVMGDRGELYYSAYYYVSNGKYYHDYATSYAYLMALKALIDDDVRVINISQNTSRLIGFAASRGNRNALDYLERQAALAGTGLSRLVAQRTAAGQSDFVICVAAGNNNAIEYYKDDTQPYGYREEMTFWEKIKYAFGWRGESGDSEAAYNNFLNLISRQEVKDRVIVVGAVGIDNSKSTRSQTFYSYAYFSNIGDRVDLVAPGVAIYSSVVDGYAKKDGTSMSTPHVAGVAGLVFASNPKLTGPEVKNILLNSTYGRYYYTGGYSGMIDAELAVVNALKTREQSVDRVLKQQTDEGLDLCFVVDTTGSMGDDIDNTKENMASILTHLAEKTENYRVALIDYRDFAERTGDSIDYPYRVQLDFTSDNEAITGAINSLSLGYGGDDEETVYSALMAAAGLDWRANAQKVIITLGDAAPLDPEPNTGYTYEQVLWALFNADINLDLDASDPRVLENVDNSLINVYSIDTGDSRDAADFFARIAEGTGGSYAGVEDASQVADAVIDSIEQIELVETKRITVDFGEDMANKSIDLYDEDGYLFTFALNGSGQQTLDGLQMQDYRWKCGEFILDGGFEVDKDGKTVSISVKGDYWFTPLQRTWEEHGAAVALSAALAIAVFFAVPAVITAVRMRKERKE